MFVLRVQVHLVRKELFRRVWCERRGLGKGDPDGGVGCEQDQAAHVLEGGQSRRRTRANRITCGSRKGRGSGDDAENPP